MRPHINWARLLPWYWWARVWLVLWEHVRLAVCCWATIKMVTSSDSHSNNSTTLPLFLFYHHIGTRATHLKACVNLAIGYTWLAVKAAFQANSHWLEMIGWDFIRFSSSRIPPLTKYKNIKTKHASGLQRRVYATYICPNRMKRVRSSVWRIFVLTHPWYRGNLVWVHYTRARRMFWRQVKRLEVVCKVRGTVWKQERWGSHDWRLKLDAVAVSIKSLHRWRSLVDLGISCFLRITLHSLVQASAPPWWLWICDNEPDHTRNRRLKTLNAWNAHG